MSGPQVELGHTIHFMFKMFHGTWLNYANYATAQRAGKFFFHGAARSHAQEPTPGSAAEHCRLLGTGGGGG